MKFNISSVGEIRTNKMIVADHVQFGELIYTAPGTGVKVWSGIYTPSNFPVAIKRQPLTDTKVLSNLINEVLLMEKLSELEAVIKFVGFFCTEEEGQGFIYILTEFSSDGDLFKVVSKRKRICKPYKEDELIQIYSRLIEVFAHMQTVNICHRDIKPDNMLVFSDPDTKIDYVKLCDFGVSKLKHTVSAKSTIAGTLFYLSPKVKQAYIEFEMGRGLQEVIHNEYKSDVYSLGATLLCVASLELSTALSRYDDLQFAISRAIEGLSYSEKIKNVINLMLRVNEDERPDFIQLNRIIEESWGIHQIPNQSLNPKPILDVQNIGGIDLCFAVRQLEVQTFSQVYFQSPPEVVAVNSLPRSLGIEAYSNFSLHSEESIRRPKKMSIHKLIQSFNTSLRTKRPDQIFANLLRRIFALNQDVAFKVIIISKPNITYREVY